MALPVAAEIGVSGERERVGRTVAPVCGQEGKLVLRVLRPGVDARPLPVEHLDRGRDGAGQPGVGAREGQVEFALIAARAEVEIDTVELGGRCELPPSCVPDRIGAGIARDVAVLKPSLGRALDASVRAAPNLELLALLREAS